MKYICNVLYVWLYDAYKDRSKANSDRDIWSTSEVKQIICIVAVPDRD